MMPKKLIRKAIFLLTLVIIGASTCVYAGSAVEWKILNTVHLESAPLDMAASPDGKRIFVLTKSGQVLIYSTRGAIIDKIDVGKNYDRIETSPRGEHLVLSSSKNSTLEFIFLDFIRHIDTTGSPFKGNKDAPVVITVFDDFQ